MDMSTIMLVYCFIISCYVISPNAAEFNIDLDRDAISTLMKRIDAMETKIKDMERLATEASQCEKVMLERIKYLEQKRSQSEILTNEMVTHQEAMQSEISQLHKEIYNQQEETKKLTVALSDASRDENKDLAAPEEENVATVKLTMNETSVLDISRKTKQSFVHHKRAYNEPVAFSVYLTHYETHLQIEQTIKYDGVLTNDRSAYNPITGIFTCPQDGLYLFAFFIGTVNAHKTWVKLVVDGIDVSNAVSEGVTIGHDDQGGNVAILRIRAGQNVWTAIHNRADAELDSLPGFRHVTFSGVRLSDYVQ